MNKLNKEVVKKEMQGLNTLGKQGRYIKKALKSVFPNAKFSVTTRIVYGIYINYNNDSIDPQDMIDTVASFLLYINDTIYINNYTCYYSDTTEYKEEQRIKYEQQQKQLEVEKEARKQLYNANVKVANISNAKITNVEDKNIFVTALEPAVNKNDWKIDNDIDIDEKSYTTKYKITDIVELNENEYDYFCFNLLQDYDFLNDKGGSCIDDDTDQLLYNYAVAVVCKDKETLIIDPQGFSYARYTCRLVEDIDGQLKKNINFNDPTPEPPRPTKKDSISVLNDTDHVENIRQNDNIINVDFTQHINKTVNATNKNTCITNSNKTTNQHDWTQDQATKKQLWALHCITKLNTANLIINKGYASKLISKSKKGNIVTVVKKLLENNDLESKCN